MNKSHLRQAQRLVADSKVREPFTELATSIDTNLWPADKYKQKLLFHGKKEMLNKKRARKGVKFITQTIMVFGCEQLLCNLFKSDRAFIDATFKITPKQFEQVLFVNFIIDGYILTGQSGSIR